MAQNKHIPEEMKFNLRGKLSPFTFPFFWYLWDVFFAKLAKMF
jgi:hypothetical protein